MHLDYRREILRYGLPARLSGELVQLFEGKNGLPAKRRRTAAGVSYKTAYRRFVNLCAAFRDLHALGYRLQSVGSLREAHVRSLVRHWEGRGEAPGTIANKLSYLRALCAWAGKRGMIKEAAAYAAAPGAMRRALDAREDKSWEGAGVDPLEVIGAVARMDRAVALQLELQWAFGLRVEESFLLRPGQALAEALGRYAIRVEHGTKGGRPRDVGLDEVVQLEVLSRAARHAASPSSTLIPRRYTLAQWRNRYYYVVRRFGIARRGGLGVTSHGLRHQYLQRKFEEITGHPAPVKGGSGHDPALYELAMRIVVERAGHSDKYKAGAYLGRLKRERGLSLPGRDGVSPQKP